MRMRAHHVNLRTQSTAFCVNHSGKMSVSTKVNEDGETLKRMKSSPPSPPSPFYSSAPVACEKIMNYVGEIKNLLDNQHYGRWLEISLSQIWNTLHSIKEGMQTSQDQSVGRVIKIVSTSGFIRPKQILTLASTNHHVFNIDKYAFKAKPKFVMYKPQILTEVKTLPISHDIKEVTFHEDFKSQLNANNLSPHITHLTFHKGSMNNYRLDLLPSTLTYIKLNDSYNLVISKLPSSLTHITFGYHFNHPISCLPHSLTHLEFNYSFNSSPYPLPENLQHLKFGHKFNQPLKMLPTPLTFLRLGAEYNHPLELPPQLTHLIFALGSKFNYSLSLPPTLTHLHLQTEKYTHPIDAKHCALVEIKASNKNMDLNDNHSISLPADTTYKFFFKNKWLPHYKDYFVPSLKYIELESVDFGLIDTFPPLPPNLTDLYIFGGGNFDFPLDYLPYTLTNLQLDDEFNQPIDNLPSSLKELFLGDNFDQPIDYLPCNLKQLDVGAEFSYPLDNLPASLLILTIGDNFNHPVDNLPPFLEEITFGKSFDQTIDLLPSTLKRIDLNGSNFNRSVNNLPPALETLIFGSIFNQPINNIPSSIQSLTLGCAFDQCVTALPSNLSFFKCCGSISIEDCTLPPSLRQVELNIHNYKITTFFPKTLQSLTFFTYNNDGTEKMLTNVNMNSMVMKEYDRSNI